MTAAHKNLLLSKRMFLEGSTYTDRSDPISSGLAISLFQDSVEIFIWDLIKEKGIQTKDGSGFVANIDTVLKNGISLKHVAKLYELNRARVGFKHYGNLPDHNEADKFHAYVEDFLRESFQEHFGVSFDDISLSDLISDSEISLTIKQAEKLCSEHKFKESLEEAAKARAIIFSRLDKLLPTVDRGLREMDHELRKIPDASGSRAFHYLTDYLTALRETTIASLLRFPVKDFLILKVYLPSALRFGDDRWQITHTRMTAFNADTCTKSIKILIDLSLRLDATL